MTLSSSYLWLSVEKWNLMECFSTESVSPESFYKERCFGNRLVRNSDVRIDSADFLLLSVEEPAAKTNCMKIRVKASSVDTNLLTQVSKKNKSLFYYPATIYFVIDEVDFYFFSQNELDAFIADSRILIQAKGVEKFFDNLHVDNNCGTYNIGIPTNLLGNAFISFDKSLYLKRDFKINLIKGALTGYTYGQKTSVSPDMQSFHMSLANIKNRLAGLHSNVMMDESTAISSKEIETSIEDLEKTYTCLRLPNTNTFKICRQLACEIGKFTLMRSEVLSKSDSQESLLRSELTALISQRNKSLAKAKHDLDYENQIEILLHIKELEKANGQAEGKERKYFPKTSEEYRLKAIAKDCIKRFELLEQSYPEAKRICEIEQILDGSVLKSYNTMLGNLFLQISDLLNDLIEKIRNNAYASTSSFDCVHIDNCLNLSVDTCLSKEEDLFYNIFLAKLLYRKDVEKYHSDSELLRLLIDSSIDFKSTTRNDSKYNSSEAESILNELRACCSFLDNKTFELPCIKRPGVQAVISFIMKPILFEQVDRFMMKRNYSRRDLTLLLWGANIGYADIPKTFTSMMYKNGCVDNDPIKVILRR